jgi:hypothetical protein
MRPPALPFVRRRQLVREIVVPPSGLAPAALRRHSRGLLILP